MILKRFWAHTDDQGTRQSVDPLDIYQLEAEGSVTILHLCSQRRLQDQRSISEVLNTLQDIFALHLTAGARNSGPFVRVHRSHAVNLLHVASVSRRSTRDFELSFEPPIAKTLPIGRGHWDEVRVRLG